jgi:hypothetical protein
MAVTFKSCLFVYNEKDPAFVEFQTHLPISQENVSQFEKQTPKDNHILKRRHGTYMNKSKTQFTGTNQLTCEGCLWKKEAQGKK